MTGSLLLCCQTPSTLNLSDIYAPKCWVDFFLLRNWVFLDQNQGQSLVTFQGQIRFNPKFLSFKTRKSKGLPLSWNSSQLNTLTHKCYFIFMVALRKFEYTIKIALWQIHGNRLPAVERTTYENLFGHWIINIFLKILSFQIFSIQLRDLSNNLLNGFNNQFWNYEYWISLH